MTLKAFTIYGFNAIFFGRSFGAGENNTDFLVFFSPAPLDGANEEGTMKKGFEASQRWAERHPIAARAAMLGVGVLLVPIAGLTMGLGNESLSDDEPARPSRWQARRKVLVVGIQAVSETAWKRVDAFVDAHFVKKGPNIYGA